MFLKVPKGFQRKKISSCPDTLLLPNSFARSGYGADAKMNKISSTFHNYILNMTYWDIIGNGGNGIGIIARQYKWVVVFMFTCCVGLTVGEWHGAPASGHWSPGPRYEYLNTEKPPGAAQRRRNYATYGHFIQTMSCQSFQLQLLQEWRHIIGLGS